MNSFNVSKLEKNRIIELHLTESKDKRFTSVLNEQDIKPVYDTIPDPEKLKRQMELERGITSDSPFNPDIWYDDEGDPVLELDEEDCLKITFKCGGSNIVDNNDVYGIHWPDYMREGMAGDGKFIYITAGIKIISSKPINTMGALCGRCYFG